MLKSTNAKVLWTFVYILLVSNVYSSHIVGGEVSYTFVEFNPQRTEATYEVTFILYRDTGGIEFEPNTDFGIYTQSNDGSWSNYNVKQFVPLSDISAFYAPADLCKKQRLSQEKVESGTYTFRTTLPIIDRPYKIAFQKCCRNHAVTNIEMASTTGAAYEVIISPESQRSGNSSPRFTNYPPTFMCVNELLDFSHTAYDKDGDQLRYSFCTPLASGGPETHTDGCCDCLNPEMEHCPPPFDYVTYVQPYSADQPIFSDPQISIDPNNGFINGKPLQMGRYVVAVCVEEYRNGRLIGSISRDFEFNIVDCVNNLSAALYSDSISYNDPYFPNEAVYFYGACSEEQIHITNVSEDENYIGSYNWELYNLDQDLVFQISDSTTSDVTLPILSAGQYYGFMILNGNGICHDTAYFSVEVLPELEPQFDYNYDPCTDGPVSFTDLTAELNNGHYTYEWILENGEKIESQNPDIQFSAEGKYTVKQIIKDRFNCAYENHEIIAWEPEILATALLNPLNLNTTSSTSVYHYEFCFDDEISIINYSNESGSISTYTWQVYSSSGSIIYSTNDQTQANLNIDNIPPGNYTGLMIINADKNCPDSVSFSINVHDEIIPEFNFQYDACELGYVHFYNATEDTNQRIESIEWNFESGDKLKGNDIQYQFEKPGYQTVILTVTDNNGCSFQTENIVQWSPEVNEDMPTLFYEEKTICPGDSIRFFERWISKENTYHKTLKTHGNQCDSVVYQVELKVHNEPHFEEIDTTLCQGDVFIYKQHEISQEISFGEIIVSENTECDSIYRNVRVRFAERPDLFIPNTIEVGPFSDVSLPLYIEGDYTNIKWSGNEDITCDDCLNPSLYVTQNQVITVTVEYGDACLITRDIDIVIDENIRFYIPNTISPSEPGNDRLFVQSKSNYNYSYELYIFDRYGNEIHHCDAICNDSNQGWLPEGINPGVFVYKVFFKDDIFPKDYTGTITVLE